MPKESHPGETTRSFEDLPGKTLLRPDEVARFLSVSPRTIYLWYRSGLIEGSKANGSLRIRRDSVVRLVEEKNLPALR